MTTELTPQQHLDAARQDRIDGRMGEKEYMSAVDRWAPQIEAPRAATETERAVDAMRELRQRRVDGKVTDAEFYREMDRLGPLADASGTVTLEGPDGSQMTMPAEFAASFEAALDPPSSPEGYQLSYAPADLDNDKNVRASLHSLGVPQAHANFMIETVERLAARFDGATEAAIKSHTASVTDVLRQRWGDQFGPRMGAVIDALAAIDGPLGDAIEAAPHVVADPLLITQIDAALTRRATRKK